MATAGLRRWDTFDDPYRINVGQPQTGTNTFNVPGLQVPGQDLGTTPGSPGVTNSLTGFDDPYTADLMKWINERMAQLSGPGASSSALSSLASRFSNPAANPYDTQISETLKRVLGEVSGAPYTATEDAARRAQAFSGIEEGRTSGLRRATAGLAALGHGRGSGTIAQALTDVNRSADTARGQAEQGLTIEGIAKADRNRAMAVSISQLMDQIARANQQATDARTMSQAQIESMIAGLENQRAGQAFQLKQLPVELQDRRLQSALQLIQGGSGSNPMSIFQGLQNLIGQVQGNNLGQQQQNQQFWQGLGGMFGNIDWGQLGLN